MSRWRWVRRRLDVLFRKRAVEEELDEEIRFHLEKEIELNLAAGMSAAEARRRALVAFGGVERFKEEVRDVRGARLTDDLVRDVQVALRGFAKQPAFLVTVLVTLGLGIGGNVAMFGILESSLFRALLYAEPERLVLGRVTYDGQRGTFVSAADYYDVREQASAFAALSAFTAFTFDATVTGVGDPERVRSPYAAWDLFRTLGVDPALGRHFLPEEGEPGGDAVAILSHGYWQRRFGGDAGVLGRSLNLDGAPTTVVGVLPEAFRFQTEADVWRPMVRGGPFAQSRQFHNFMWIGRLAPGVDMGAAQAEVDAINAHLAELYPDSNRGKGMYLQPLHEALVEDYRTTLWVLAAAVVALLLVACANAAGILLARGSTRRAEMAVRSVMGAGRRRLVRQLLVENVLLALGAGVLGLLAAGVLQRGILTFVALDQLGGVAPGLSPRTLGAAVALASVTLALFGVLPALRMARIDPARVLAGGGVRSGASRDTTRFRSALVVAQVALTVVLLMVSGLLVRSLALLRGVDAGFEVEELLTAEVPLPQAKYQDVTLRPQMFAELQRRVAALRGVEAVGLSSLLPIKDPGNNVRVGPIEAWAGDASRLPVAFQRTVLPGYFDALGVPLLAGRDVAPTDDRAAPAVVVLSESLATSLFPEGSALGRVVGVDVGGDEPLQVEVIGVVGDVAAASLYRGKEATMYFSYGQRSPASMRLLIRARGEAPSLVPAIRDILRDLDPDVPLAGVATMEDVVARSLSERRAVVVVLGAFGAVALLLSAVGLYGMLAYQVSLRVREIGVRMALGASAGSVSRGVVLGGLRLVGLGLALAIPASVLAAHLVQDMLFQVGATDLGTYAGVGLFFVAVSTVACFLPAFRASRVDPAVAFRAE